MTVTLAEILSQFNIVFPMCFYVFYLQQLDMLKYKPIPTWLALSAALVSRFFIFEKLLAIPTENPVISIIGILIMVLIKLK